ncbi:hypothetical protein GCM10010345_53670 [Streptomyces canarius]|uniref:Uncharacterized protein n=1 Tax=Streptomyces canarius TaxID=285453 RepID=A0ABQ3CUB9_9ACTN|nr:hypothetical protein GCM10010345_53670 [Streptomyces canarius]
MQWPARLDGCGVRCPVIPLSAADVPGPVLPTWATVVIVVVGAPLMAVRLYRTYCRRNRD